jgi:hypothetical protein
MERRVLPLKSWHEVRVIPHPKSKSQTNFSVLFLKTPNMNVFIILYKQWIMSAYYLILLNCTWKKKINFFLKSLSNMQARALQSIGVNWKILNLWKKEAFPFLSLPKRHREDRGAHFQLKRAQNKESHV